LPLLILLVSVVSATDLSAQLTQAVKIVAPDRLSVKVYKQPSASSEMVGIALDGDILEMLGTKGEFIEVKLPDKTAPGFVPKDYTVPWSAPADSSFIPKALFLIIPALVLAAVGIALFLVRSRKKAAAVKEAAGIPATIKRAEELYRAGDFFDATREFNRYLTLHGGEVRNPDVYRRLAVCYQRTEDIQEAVRNWEKMRSLAGLKRAEDYMIGVELMSACGREAEAAEIYEQFLETERDEEATVEVHEKLFHIYRRLDDPKKLLDHAVRLMELRPEDAKVLTDTVHFLVTENRTDLAAECGNKTIIQAICNELLEDKVTSPEAGRIYLKCLEYDRTDLRIHRMLADIYGRGGDFKRAVSELTILHQLDRDQSDAYIEEAARLYVDHNRVSDALAEGNPLIIKKIAQIFLSKSQVHNDAVATYERVLEFQPRAVGINKMLATVYLTRGDPDKYMARLRILHEIDGANHDYMNDLAICIIDNGLIEQTIKEGNRELNASILKHLIKSGAHDDKTIALLEKLIKYEPDNAVLLNALVNAYENRSNYRKCFEYLLNLIKVKPENKQLLQKAKSLDAAHHLVEPLLKQGHGKLLVGAALALIDRHATDTFALNMMEFVRTEEYRINEYLAGLNRPEKKSTAKTKTVELPVSPSDKTKKDLDKSKPRITARKEQITPSEEPAAHSGKPKLEKMSRSTENKKPQSASAPTPDPAAAPTNDTSQAAQVVELMDAGRSSSEAVTTFVSGHAKGIKAADYNPNELFRPATGGLAYKDTDLVFADGWGNLCKGIEINTGRKVLMRIIRKDLLEPESMKEFLGAIGDVGFNLVHDNILRLEELTSGKGGVPALIYPQLDLTLEQAAQSPKRPELETLISITGKIVDGVAFAHQYKGLDGKLRRTFHLHLQPSNVMLSSDFKECRILGFGYSQIFRAISGARLPRWQDPGMNPVTMPPEFFSSQPGVIREKAAEIYSLGVLMYFILVGEYPFEGPALLDYKVQHRTIHATPPKLANPAAPNWLELIIMRCLEKDPDKRWDNATEIQKAFREGANQTT